jgi:hypothetical protein
MPRTRTDDWFDESNQLETTSETWDFPLERKRKRGRIAKSATIVTLFFAGAAFTAGAGDVVATKLQEDACAEQAPAASAADEAACSAAAAADPAAAPAEPAEPATPAAPEEAPAPAEPAAEASASDDTEAAPDSVGARARSKKGASGGGDTAGEAAGAPSRSSLAADDAEPVLRPAAPAPRVPLKEWQSAKKRPAAPMPEIEGNGTPVVWLNRALPDPTPPAKRLRGAFATNLMQHSKAAGADWALVLGVLRASGESGSKPATAQELTRLASRLSALGAEKDAWGAVLALDGHTAFADRAIALANYNRAIGLWALVHGLEAAKEAMTNRLLHDPQVSIYAAGRADLAEGRVDVRVVALIAYLREAFGQVTISSLISGHGLYARPGVVSAHIYGQAVDIAALAGINVFGHQQPGSVTERAVRAILLVPSELQPRQVISLLGLGGPSFPLANHDDHLHVGF